MEDKLKPIIKDNNIINKNEIINIIKKNLNEEFLEDYLLEIEDYENNSSNIINGLSNIKENLLSRLNEIKVNKLNAIENKLISENEFNRFLGMLYSDDKLTKENYQDLYLYVNTLLINMQEENLEYDKQNSIDIYIYYLKDRKQNDLLNEEENNILKKYKNIIIKKNQQLENQKKSETDKIKKLKLLSKQNSTRGAIISVVILETTILLGILISIIALAKR